MNNLEDRLTSLFDDMSRAAPHEPDLADTIRRRSRRRNLLIGAPTSVAVVVLAVLVGSAVFGRSTPDAASAPTKVSVCGDLQTGPLPEWARAGFTAADPSVPFAYGANGAVIAVLFGPLSTPPAPGNANKILWIARPAVDETTSDGAVAPDPLRIRAELEGTTVTVDREIPGGPGPSTIDLPAPGCWTMHLTWGPNTDTISLRYLAG